MYKQIKKTNADSIRYRILQINLDQQAKQNHYESLFNIF